MSGGEQPTVDTVERVFREERGRLLASLVRHFGDLDLAEEVASDAIEAALLHWPVQGVPARPAAWLLTTARHRAVDRLRRDRAYAARLAVLQAEAVRDEPAAPARDGDGDLPDDRLRLFFTCCHPALPAEAQIALTLRYLAGLGTAEVARAFLVPVTTMAQRIGRAKKKIRAARIPFRVPDVAELPARLPGALTGRPGPYAVQAAIAALHGEAPEVAGTDWPQVVALYDVLARVAPSPLVELNRAVAVALRDGPGAGLSLLDALDADGRLAGYHLLPAARADLLRRLSRTGEAATAYRRALELVGNEPERAFLRRRLAEVAGEGLGDSDPEKLRRAGPAVT